MTNNNTRIAKNTIFMYFRMLITMVVSIYTSRVILATLGFEDYGLNNVIGGIISMFSIVVGGLNMATSRYITFYQGKEDLNKQKLVFSMSMYIYFIMVFLLVVFGETIGLWYLHNKLVIPAGREFAAEWLYQMSVVTAAVSLINVPYSATIIAHEKMSMYAYMSIWDVLVKLVIVFALTRVVFDKLIFMASCFFILGIVDRFIYGWYCNRYFLETHLVRAWDGKLFKEMFGFAGWGFLGSASYLLNTQGINLMINSFFGTSINAARGIAVHVENIVKQFMSNVQTAINPQITKAYASGDMDRMFLLVYASSRYCFFMMLCIIVPIMFIAPYLLEIWLGKYPDYTVVFVRLILINTIMDSFINPLWTANNASGKVKVYQLAVNVTSLLCLPIIYFVLKITQKPEAVFLALIIETILCMVVRLVVLRKTINLHVFLFIKKVILPAIYVTFIATIIPILYVLYRGIDNFTQATILGLIMEICLFASIYYIGLGQIERDVVQNKICIIKSFIKKWFCNQKWI